MVSRFALAAGSLAALLCLGFSASAQSSGTAATPAPTQQAAPPSQTNSQQAPQGGLAPGAAPLHLQDLPPDDHTPTPAEVAEEQRQRALQNALRVAALEARWGPQISTPGVAIALVETGRTKTPDGATQITWQITGSGFRPGEHLSLVRWNLGEPMRTLMGDIVLDSSGHAVCAAPAQPAAPNAPAAPAPAAASAAPGGTAPAKPAAPLPPPCTQTMKADQPVTIQAVAAPGEAIRVALIGADRSNGAATSVVPYPIVNADKGCSLQAILAMKDASLDIIQGNGFPPSSTVKVETTTAGQTQTLNSKTDPNGRMVFAVLPAEHGGTSGETTVRYVGILHTPGEPPAAKPDPACAPVVTIHWGEGTYKPQ
ncbi:MAG TPA: hypothetical protein VMD25_08680 [Acidobacteriaceae bacterium]|nr:hypothetical protein [Acidobacteriaceae bacterium]